MPFMLALAYFVLTRGKDANLLEVYVLARQWAAMSPKPGRRVLLRPWEEQLKRVVPCTSVSRWGRNARFYLFVYFLKQKMWAYPPKSRNWVSSSHSMCFAQPLTAVLQKRKSSYHRKGEDACIHAGWGQGSPERLFSKTWSLSIWEGRKILSWTSGRPWCI